MQYIYAAAAILVSSIVAPVVTLIALQYVQISKVPCEIPWVDLRGKRWFPKLRANMHQFSIGRAALEEGWVKYGKHNKPFVLPGTNWPEIVLPPSNVHWIATQPEHIISDIVVQDELLGIDYFTHGPTSASVHDFTPIRRDMTRQMGKVLPDVLDEISASFTEGFGTNTEDWQEVLAIEKVISTAHRAVNRVYVGLPSCRDQRYLTAAFRWEFSFAVTGAVFRQLIPHELKPLFGPIAAMPLACIKWLAIRRILPTIRERVRKLKADGISEKTSSDDEKPNDMLQWIIETNAQKSDPAELEPWNVAGKVLLLDLFATHTTSTTAGAALLDMLSYPTAAQLLAELREEADAVMPKLVSDPQAIRDMVKMDSTIRETLRLHPMFAHGMMRQVVARGGVTTPDGLYLPQGCNVSASIVYPQMESCDNGQEYQPLRFYHQANGPANPPPSMAATAEGIVDHQQTPQTAPTKQTMTVQISDQFLSFGLGKHACPGRFFAVQTLKLMLGYLVTHYDLEPLAERPKFDEIGEIRIPSAKTVLKVRRREMELTEGDNGK
ncbi:hypothetical protein LTR36_007506 [Oleoguttula mirabilis]|uniref:Cytochrome P450 n=1 Tax=Oleoguttula mirabilis TaxID=1507867 RepID=A0AAV9JTZ9_9PEZI|nr:hypothetical protein LTR36_007506 [Oleoguttula mirabilis]